MTDSSLTPDRFAAMQSLFERALEVVGSERDVLLRQAAIDDPVLAREVRALLAAHEQTGSMLHSPVGLNAIRDLDPPVDPHLGKRVGVYQVIERIGAGGMGTVYEAVRADDQYQRRVAIKFLRQYAASDIALQRFREERQILANLDHPNIAALLDGGVTDDGQPYFVMEYLEGEPITVWCDARATAIGARLKLFEQVCAAVQYAHQNLVVHRDLKPGNILVTSDGTVKLLDFGIAKLLPADAAAAPGDLPVTSAGARAYTPEYASPEQLLGLPVGTASDVYALGVILYELLTGNRPFDFAGKTAGEVERVVSEVSPTRPSAVLRDERWVALRERSVSRARTRIAGDLDAIVLNALRKEPARRYRSAAELAADVRRHIDGRPVLARPDSVAYRLGKLIRRRKLETAAVTLAVLSLAGGVVATTVKAREAIRERERVTEVKAFLTTMLGAASPASFGKDVTMRTVLDSAVLRADAMRGSPGLEAEIRDIIGNTYLALGDFELGEAQFRRQLALTRSSAPDGSRQVAAALTNLSSALENEGHYAAADSVLLQAGSLFDRFTSPDDPTRADNLDRRGRILVRLGRMAEAAPLLGQSLDIELRAVPRNDSTLSDAYASVAVVQSELGNNAKAETLLVAAVAAAKRAYGPVHPLVAAVLSPLGTVQERAGAMERADSTFREALAIRLKVLGPVHPEYAWTMFNYADHLLLVGRNAEAAQWCYKVLALRGKTLTDAHPAIATAMAVLGRALGRMDSLAAGERWLRESWAVRKANLPANHYLIASSESILGEHLVLAKRFKEAEAHLLAGERALVEARGEDAPIIQDARQRLVKLYVAWEKPEDAAKWRGKLK